MAIAKAYGSITIVDIGDLGTLSVYPESNQPTSVIYDPNTNNGTYNPDWTSSNLRLTPIIYYGGLQIDAFNVAISVDWKRKVKDTTKVDGVNLVAISEDNGESMDRDSKKLIVNKNILNASTPIITYVCTVTYEEPQTGTKLTAKGEISFSLISQPTSIKSCSIVGESVFLYRSDRSIKGSGEITLTANLNNCGAHATDVWQYKTSTGKWMTIPGQLGTTLVVNESSNSAYFVNDAATIRFQTNITGLYDVHSITKIYDGVAGEGTFVVTLSNEDMHVPCDDKYEILDGGLDNAITEIKVYNGEDNVTNNSNTTISDPKLSGLTGEWHTRKTNDDSETNKPSYKITGMTALTGTATFTVTYTENGKSKTVYKTFYLTKLRGEPGKSPEIYGLELSTVVLNKTAETHIYNPTTFIANAYKTVGSEKTAYAGRIKIYQDNTEVGTDDERNNDRSSREWTPPNGTPVSTYKVELYAAGGSGDVLDTQTIAVISDGVKGDTGAGGLSFVLGNYSDHIPCTAGGLTSSDYTITIPFAAYQGTQRVACKATLSALPNGMSCHVLTDITPATKDSDGIIRIYVASKKDLGGTTTAYDTGTITVTLTTTDLAENPSTQKSYTWTKNKQGASGANAVLLRAYAPNGNIINNGENDVALSCTLTEGTTTVTPTSYKWHIFDTERPGYVQITEDNTYGGHTGYTTNTLIVPATTVSSYASYCVEVTYGGKPYKDYISVQDKTDPLQVEIFSTLGDKITNGVGVGCIYAKVYQNGMELDALQNLKVSATEPSSPLEGDVWAHIDQTTQSIILKRRQGSSWTAFTLTDTECQYNWIFADYDGAGTNLNNETNSSAKFLYIQGSYITKKMQFNLEVTKQ
jgi:hypothetical protein